MTAIVSYASDNISIILSDRKVTKYGTNNKDEEKIKLVKLPNDLGWVSGAGSGAFLDEFKETISNPKVNSIYDISNLFNDKVNDVIRECPSLSEIIKEVVLILSWVDSEYKTRLGILSKKNNDDIQIIPNNYIYIVYPPEYLKNHHKIDELKAKYQLYMNFDGDIKHILLRLLNIFDEISSNSKYVSRFCDIGVQGQSGKGSFEGDVKKLIEEIEKIS